MKKLILALPFLLLTGCAESYEYENVQGVVIDKEHDKARNYVKTTTDSNGNKVQKRVYEEEEFEVTIRYETIEKEFEFEDDSFYKQVEIGDAVNLQLEKGIDKNGEIVSRDIELSNKK